LNPALAIYDGRRMIGSFLNAGGILLGGAVGLFRRRPMSPANEAFAKVGISVLTVFYGLRLTWLSLGGPFAQVVKQVVVLVVALILGRLAGRLLRLQKASNQVGQWARATMTATQAGNPNRAGNGFKVCAALFCVAPLATLGALQGGVTSPEYFYPLAVKGVVDGLATLGLVPLFGWGVLLAALPVLAFEGTLTLLCGHFLEPLLRTHGLVDPVNAVGGVLVFSVALVMLGIKKVELADYLPSLAIAPLLAALWR
jgi:uncharacterized membrane protein YqgA involved in biofilm formation